MPTASTWLKYNGIHSKTLWKLVYVQELCICIYIYIERGRERQRERQMLRLPIVTFVLRAVSVSTLHDLSSRRSRTTEREREKYRERKR